MSDQFLLLITLFLPLITLLIIVFLKDNAKELSKIAKTLAIFSSVINLLFTFYMWNKAETTFVGYNFITNYSIYKLINFSFNIGVDNISLLFIFLTNFVFVVIFVFSGHEKPLKHTYYQLLLLLQLSILFTFAAINILLFYIFFELSVFITFLIMNTKATNAYHHYKFLLFNFLGSLIMLVGIVYVTYTMGSGSFKTLFYFDFNHDQQSFLWWIFFIALSIKSGIFPFHIWVPSTYTNNGHIVNIILTTLLIKFGVYGFIRLVLPNLILANIEYAVYAKILLVITALYTMIIAFTRDNIKSFIAYFSVSHVAIIILGLFSLTVMSIEGALFQSFSHSIFMLGFILIFICIEKRNSITNFSDISNLVNKMPLTSFFLMIFILAGMSVPGTNAFIGEFLILQGLFISSVNIAIVTTLIVIFSSATVLIMYKKLVYNQSNTTTIIKKDDIKGYEIVFLLIIASIIIILGLFPQIILECFYPYSNELLKALEYNLSAH